MPRDERVGFTKNEGISIQLPPLISVLKYTNFNCDIPMILCGYEVRKIDKLIIYIFPINNRGDLLYKGYPYGNASATR